MAKKVKRLDARSRLEGLFVSVSPLLEALYIFVLVWFTPQEIFFIILLLDELRKAMTDRIPRTHPSGACQIGDHALQIADRHRGKLPIIIHR